MSVKQMSTKQEMVYIKADRNVEVTKPDVSLGDALSITCSNKQLEARLKTLRLVKFRHTDKKLQNRITVSVLKVVELIQKEYPQVEVQNLGETDFIVTYEMQQTAGGVAHVCKAVLVVVICFLGAAFSIMSFNNDVDVTKLFSQIYELFTGQKSSGFTILELSYSVGIVIGILVFFNHIGRRRFTVDPTPMEVEMRLYENDIQTTLIENSSRKGRELDVGDTDTSGSNRT